MVVTFTRLLREFVFPFAVELFYFLCMIAVLYQICAFHIWDLTLLLTLRREEEEESDRAIGPRAYTWSTGVLDGGIILYRVTWLILFG